MAWSNRLKRSKRSKRFELFERFKRFDEIRSYGGDAGRISLGMYSIR
jgi:hypothetical protein